MADEKDETAEQPKLSHENTLGEHSGEVQRVALVSSSPSVRSIIRVVLVVLALLAIRDFLGVVISSLTYLFFIIVLAIFFAYLINPLVDLIHKPFENVARGKLVPRSLAIAIAFLLVFSVIGTGIYLLAPRISDQGKTFAANIPAYTTAVQSTMNDLNRRLDRMRVSDSVQTQINDRITAFVDSAGTFLTTLFGLGAIYLLGFLPWLVLVPILAFFFLKDAHLFRVALLRVVPVGEWRTRVESFLSDVNKTLVAYTRAQIISCLWIGLLCTIGFYIIGNDYALILGVLAGIFELVPLLGPLTIAILATIIAGFESGWHSLWTVMFLAALRISQDYFFYPRIVREGIHLHPLAVILSVLAGEQVAGIAGVFIAIPIVALATVLYKHILEHTDSRGLFTGLLEPKENKEITSGS